MEYATAGLLIVFLLVVVVLGPLYGADSRDGRDWRPTGPRPQRKHRGVAERARRQVALWDAYLTANQPWREQGPLRWRRIGDQWLLEGDTPPALPGETPVGRDTGTSGVRGRDGVVDNGTTRDPGTGADVDNGGGIDGDVDDGRGLRIGPSRDGS